jgi:hypothetical protein
MRAQTFGVSCVDQLDSASEFGIPNALVRRQSQHRGIPMLNKRLEFRPARKTVLVSNGEVRVTELKISIGYRRVGAATHPRVKFTQPMQRLRNASAVRLEQVRGLMLQMDKVRLGRQSLRRHNELPYVMRLCPHMQAESSFAAINRIG